MSRFRRIETIEPSPSLFVRETSIFAPQILTLPQYFPSFAFEDELDFALDLRHSTPALIDFTSPFHEIDAVTDLIRIEKTPLYTSTRRVQRRVDRFGTELNLQSLCDRVSALELSFDRLVNAKPHEDRKYTWTAEIKGPEKWGLDRKYEWKAEIKGGKKKEKGGLEKNYKWTAEIKGPEKCSLDRKYEWKADIKGGKKKEKGGLEKNYKWTAEIKDKDAPISRTYTFKATTGDAVKTVKCSGSEKKEKKWDTGVVPTRVVEIEEPSNHGAAVLRQAFVKRANCKGKRKELSPKDAAMMIQVNFRAYLIRRSQVLRALRELAAAKAKLKEIRALFNNFTYRRHVAHDDEERQRFSEKIIVLLLTVDAIEGADLMVRSAKKKELAAGVAEVVQMLDQENNTFEARL
ncbi:BCL-2-associated athanogene 7 [Actinidia rufa]|uniref:BCL-2-associated athanogene 7 n=1 Tax=Actinidia rufa TaxID=165716 RepID=A0A7J0ECZ2_9ERIC|nr:BCL-2-associated athanogene 7 [Actinidia rufa]